MSKNITINGVTYNGIESVSVNGNIFGEGGSSDYTEEVLRRNFNPNGQAFIDTVSINLANGDYIEAQFDITDQPAGRICFSVGNDIQYWPSSEHICSGIYIYANQNRSGYYSMSYILGTYSGQSRSTNRQIPSGNNKIKIKVDAAGFWVNDSLLKYSTFEQGGNGHAIHQVMSTLIDAQTLQVGAAQSDNDYSYATYEYIKVFRKV